MKEILEQTPCLKEEELKRYLSEQSPNEELRRVENHLLDCPFCSDAVEGLEQYYSFEADDGLEKLKLAIEEKEPAEEQEAAKVISMSRRSNVFTLNRIAAAVLLLLVPVASWFYMSNNTTGSPTGFGNSTTMRSTGGGTEEGSDLLKVISLYDAGQYEASLAATQAMLEKERADVKTTYYAGLSALKTEEYKLAADYFMTVRMNSDFYYEEATWLEIQARIGAEEMELAKLMLDELIERKKSSYLGEAEVLRKGLD
ncbi:MAG: hypothetical protein ACI8YQ_001973 [Polaribacter sp.]|jgi:hypothetical protein